MRKMSFRHVLLLAAVVGMLAVGALFNTPSSEAFQFIDRIVRPCATGIVPLASVIVNPNNSGNINATPCTGGTFTVNGVPVIPGGVTCTGCTIGTLPYYSAASALANSPITRPSATHLIFFNGSSTNADFDSSTPAITITVNSIASTFPQAGSNGTVTLAASALTVNRILLGGGNSNVSILGSLGTTTTVLHGNAAGAPTFGAVSLTADVSGDLPFSSFVPATAISKLVGRGAAAGAGDFQEITLGSGLTMTGTTLSAAGGVTCAGCTSGTLPYYNGSNLADSPITRSSATHVFIFAGGTGGADFDSSTPAININSDIGTTTIGDINGVANGTLIRINDSTSTITSTGFLEVERDIKATNNSSAGTVSFPFGSLFIDNGGGSSIQLTGTAGGGAKVATFPNATGTVLLDTTAGTLSGTTGSIGGGALLAGDCASGTVAVTSSTTSMTVSISPNTYPGDGALWYGYVSANGTVTVKVCGVIALTPNASTYNVRVIQ